MFQQASHGLVNGQFAGYHAVRFLRNEAALLLMVEVEGHLVGDPAGGRAYEMPAKVPSMNARNTMRCATASFISFPPQDGHGP